MKPKTEDSIDILSWDRVEHCINNIVNQIEDQGHTIDRVVGINRGGNIPGVIIAYKLGVPYVTMYNEATWDENFSNALIVDDVCDNGNTFNSIMDHLEAHHATDNVLTAALYVKPWATFNVDFIGASSEDWVCFPWETEEFDREWNNG